MLELIKFRPQRGSLQDSMVECVVLPRSLNALAEHLQCKVEEVKVESYFRYDDRVNWDTFLVTVNGCGVGFTNGSVCQS
jgi:hypothetical protein